MQDGISYAPGSHGAMKGALYGRIWTQPLVPLPYQATEIQKLARRGRRRWQEELWSGLHGCKGGLNIFESLPRRPPSNSEATQTGTITPLLNGSASPKAPQRKRSEASLKVLDVLSGHAPKAARKNLKASRKSIAKTDADPIGVDDLPVTEEASSGSDSAASSDSEGSGDFEPPVGIQKDCFQITAFGQSGRRIKRTWNQRIWDLNAKLHRTQKMAILWAQETQRHLQEVADKALVKNCLLCWMKYAAHEIAKRHVKKSFCSNSLKRTSQKKKSIRQHHGDAQSTTDHADDFTKTPLVPSEKSARRLGSFPQLSQFDLEEDGGPPMVRYNTDVPRSRHFSKDSTQNSCVTRSVELLVGL